MAGTARRAKPDMYRAGELVGVGYCPDSDGFLEDFVCAEVLCIY